MTRRRILVVDDHLELAELLAAAIENEGVSAAVATSGSGALDEIRAERPDLAIVDLMLPDMLGTEVLDALAAESPPVPAVAISGVFRGERYDRVTVERHGARRFFEKPFQTGTVVTEVLALLDRIGDRSEEAPREDAPVGDEPLFEVDLSETVHPDATEEIEVFPDAATVLGEETGDVPASPAPTRPRDALHRRLGFVEDLIPVAAPARGSGEGPASQVPDPSAPAGLVVRPKPVAPRDGPPPRGGEIGPPTVPRLLAAFAQAGSTGALELRRGKVAKVIHLRDGRPTFAGSNLGGDRLLTFAVNRRAIRREDAESALALAKEGGRRIGEVLIELGVLDRIALKKLVRDQVRAIVWSTFAWREGRYAVRPHREGRREPVTLDLPLGRLVIDGTIRAVPLLVLREDLPDDACLTPRPAPTVPVESLDLSADEARLLSVTDGTKTVADLLALSDDDERTVRAVLRALWDLGVLGLREQVEARSRRIGFVV